MRSVLCDPKLEGLLANYGNSSKLTIGLIIGQIAEKGKDLVVHLAKTQIHSKRNREDGEEEEETEVQEITKVTEINNTLVAEHAINCIRMIVGGFNILGLFVVSENNIFNDTEAVNKLKTIVLDVKK